MVLEGLQRNNSPLDSDNAEQDSDNAGEREEYTETRVEKN